MNCRMLFVFTCLLTFSCTGPKTSLENIESYFPAASRLTEGIASKYYRKYVPKNPDANLSIDISYTTYQFFQPDVLLVKSYDAGFQERWEVRYQVKDGSFQILDCFYVTGEERIKSELMKAIEEDWNGGEAISEFSTMMPNGYTSFVYRKQNSMKDTIVEGRSAKRFSFSDKTLYINEQQDTTIYEGSTDRTYAAGIGLYSQVMNLAEGNMVSTLVEQMPLSDFEKRRNHGKKRMAYIDPDYTMDDHSGFKLCKGESEIGDYYNCDYRAQLEGGKGAWWRVLKESLRAEKLEHESGYLTYRFVVNCSGEVGRFMTEESDLDFNKKKFNKETVQHLYELVSAQENWQPCSGRRGDQDSYTYVTFKLKDGKIIEILP